MKPLIQSWGGTTLFEVDATSSDKIINFINSPIKFPTYVTSAYSGLGVKFKIIFQGIQNYIPDDDGKKLPNTITNSLKIFNEFPDEEEKEFNASLPLFDITYSGDQVILNFKEDIEYPDTLKLPIVDAYGNQITTISADFGQNITSSKIIVPSGYTTIEEGAFQNNKNIQSVDLSKTSITVISDNAFYGSSVESVLLPDTIKEIGRYAFQNSSLSSIILPEGLTTIRTQAFYIVNLQSIYIPASVTSLSKNAFIYSPYLETIMVDEANSNYYDVDDCCIIAKSGDFHYLATMYSNQSFEIPENVTNLCAVSMLHSKIAELTIPSTLKTIQDEALPLNLTKININSKNTYLSSPTGNEIIENSSGILHCVLDKSTLIEYTIPNSITIVAPYAFRNSYVKIVNMHNGNITLKEYSFCYASYLTTINNMHSNITIISEAFLGAGLSEITLYGSIPTLALHNMNLLKKVSFSSNVTNIASKAISGCAKLQYIIFESTTPPTFATSTFIGGTINSNLKIYVPDSAVSAYKAVSNLSSYASRIVGISTYTG